MTTASTEIIEALIEAGVEYIFGNLGSDHPGLIEALAELDRRGRDIPRVIICPHEMSALSAAQGYAMATGRPQAVFVHTDVGTANLGGSVHNAARTRVPVLIFAGRTPITMEGELRGTRDTYINHLQDVADQHALVRPYVKWDYEVRTGRNARQLVYRSLQLATSAPAGPVYLTASREVLAEEVPPVTHSPQLWGPIDPIPLATDTASAMLRDLESAQAPLIVTTYVGRNPAAVNELVTFAERWGIPVVEANPTDLNFPATHPLHLGYNPDELIAEADLIVAVDTDVPWVQARRAPAPNARVYVLDPDPLKEEIPLWYVPANRFVRVDSHLAFTTLNHLPGPTDTGKVEERKARLGQRHQAQRDAWRAEGQSTGPRLSAARVGALVAEHLDDSAVLLNEAITSAEAIFRQIPRILPGTLYANGGSSLGWSGGGALGLRLAKPDQTVVNIVGDGSYLLSVPSSTYWMARRYELPTVTVILNNAGWNATKQNVIRQYPDGIARDRDQFWVNLSETADLAAIAEAAGGVLARRVGTDDELRQALGEAFDAVAQGRSAVVDVQLAEISNQQD